MSEQAGPSTLPTTCLQGNYMIKKVGEGVFGSVYASIPKTVADQILSAHAHALASKREILAHLRAALQAVKVSDGPSETGLNDEVAILQRLANDPSPHIVSLLSTDPIASPSTWYTLELLTCGTLEDLLEAYILPTSTLSPCPEAFIWHLLHDLAFAFLLIHFGTRGDCSSSSPSAPRLTHGDVHLGNLLLRRPGSQRQHETSFRDYPDLVLADFGRAREVPSTHAPVHQRAMAFHRQVNDVRSGVAAVERIARMGTEVAGNLAGVWDGFASIFTAGEGTGTNEELRWKLVTLRNVAGRKRERLYQPLQASVTAYLEREVVSDEELESVFLVRSS